MADNTRRCAVDGAWTTNALAILRRLILAAVACCGGAVLAEAREVVLYTYHDKPPYYLHSPSLPEEPTGGIYLALARFLNAEQSQFRFAVRLLPRRRLEMMLEASELRGGIIGVNPLWFKDKERTRFLWSAPFMADKDVVVVSGGKGFPYQHPRDLVSRSMALPRGFYYWGVTELAGEGKIALTLAANELQCLRMVQDGRADATIVSQLTLDYYVAEQAFPGAIEALEVPHDSFERMILMPRAAPEVLAAIDQVLTQPARLQAWRRVLRKYSERNPELSK